MSSLTIVRLPNFRPQVALPSDLAKVLKLIIASGTRGITLFELTARGCTNPMEAISNLEIYGASFFPYEKLTYDGGCISMSPHYSYLGWI